MIKYLPILILLAGCGSKSSGSGGTSATPTPTATSTDTEHVQTWDNATYKFTKLTKTTDSDTTEFTPSATTLKVKFTYDSYSAGTKLEAYMAEISGAVTFATAPWASTTSFGCTTGSVTYEVDLNSDGEDHYHTISEDNDNCNLSTFQLQDNDTYTFTKNGLIRDESVNSTTYEWEFDKM